MVTEESVKHAAQDGQYLPMEADHSSIVKFTNRSDQHYQIVRRKLLEIALEISITPPKGTFHYSIEQYFKVSSPALLMLMSSQFHVRKE